MDSLRKRITQLREDFMLMSLDESQVDKLPALQFEAWLNDAMTAEIPEWQALTLSTVSEKNTPASRIVYLREFKNDQFWFYGNYQSRKANHLKQNPNAAFNFFWPQLERQIRIEGTVTPCDASSSDNYFFNRPLESKLGAWASPQSTALQSRAELDKLVEKYRKEFEGKEVSRPPYWGGWILQATYYEFWQGRKSRLHDRICYELEKKEWKIKRIAP